ncbi:MAG: hypothetical protein B1H12_01545 [Desulfobacteraceae bacterium 4484_190.2]|nr:MAG: hypothetical protein B1H12_01545 [Desulfobacteraceae bacterium 4484_190.2]
MIEVRFHGRGGQGAVVASKIMANAVFFDGKYSQSFPAFGVERRGAPVAAFLRVDSAPIRLRTEIYEPDYLVILDPILIEQIPVTRGLKPAKVLGIVTMDNLVKAIKDEVPLHKENNAEAARDAYQSVSKVTTF